MKKLNILKTIVDLSWIFLTPFILITLIAIPYILFVDNSNYLDIHISGFRIKTIDFPTKMLIVTKMVSYLILIYCVYIFGKILEYFQLHKIFDEFVLKNFNKMGVLLVVCSFIMGIPSILYEVFYAENVTITFGFTPFLLCMGMFFMVLSEIFKISRNMKEENELTI
ncbi:MAG: hypothetical protein A3F91_14240 [Flavobacteria bacterium RIFCSPLOWO2_12_FULL_35_11]|nr:MAG: hypothetical protein A3F91_14240 [Flavobacteria bacterium RIFCSPLOWO2_12_FULL_35_11]